MQDIFKHGKLKKKAEGNSIELQFDKNQIKHGKNGGLLSAFISFRKVFYAENRLNHYESK